MDKTKIEWCDASWNPVTGCLHTCPYCYARRMVKRFEAMPGQTDGTLIELDAPAKGIHGGVSPYPYGFTPTLHRYRLDVPKKWTKPRTIFVCSMADLFGDWVPDRWISDVFSACSDAPQHRYLFLTKNPQRYLDLAERGLLPEGDNFWFGTTTSKADDLFFFASIRNSFVSVEPMLEDVAKDHRFDGYGIRWVILGAETGNRKGKVVPEKSWIENCVTMCQETGVPVFMKDSLLPVVGEAGMLREFPWDEMEL